MRRVFGDIRWNAGLACRMRSNRTVRGTRDFQSPGTGSCVGYDGLGAESRHRLGALLRDAATQPRITGGKGMCTLPRSCSGGIACDGDFTEIADNENCFISDKFGDLERCSLRSRQRAQCRRPARRAAVRRRRCRGKFKRRYFHADAAFAVSVLARGVISGAFGGGFSAAGDGGAGVVTAVGG